MARPVPAKPTPSRATPAVSPKVKNPPPKEDTPDTKLSSSRDPADRSELRSQFAKAPVNDEQTRSAIEATKGQPVKPDPVVKEIPVTNKTPGARAVEVANPGPSKAAQLFEEAKATAGPPVPTGAGPGLGEGLDSASKSMARSLWEGSDLGGVGGAIKELGRIAGPVMAYDILHNLGWFDTGGTKPGFGDVDWKAAQPQDVPVGDAPKPTAKDIYQGNKDQGFVDKTTFANTSAPPPDAVDVRAAAQSKLDSKDKSAPTSGSPATSKGQSGVQTKGGFYPIFDKGSDQAKSFEQAYGDAKQAGTGTFTWQDRSYNTK